jgi:hypothetical protein
MREYCPICGCKLVLLPGFGWDYDHLICPQCHYEIELNESTEGTCSE